MAALVAGLVPVAVILSLPPLLRAFASVKVTLLPTSVAVCTGSAVALPPEGV